MSLFLSKANFANFLIKEKPALFLGAGISVNPPSYLPLSKSIKEHFLDILFADLSHFIKITKYDYLALKNKLEDIMLEAFLEIIINHSANSLNQIFNIFNNALPNELHYGFVMMLKKRICSAIITTNFDMLMESANQKIEEMNMDLTKIKIYFDKFPKSKLDIPAIFKLHGSINKQETIQVILSQVGLGLDLSKRNILSTYGDIAPFVFIGYSDRDKDITPALKSLKNQWIWFEHDNNERIIILKGKNFAAKSELDKLIKEHRGVKIICNIPAIWSQIYQELFPAVDFNIFGQNKNIVKPNWQYKSDKVFNNLKEPIKVLILGDILIELLGEKEFALSLYKNYLKNKPKLTTGERGYILLGIVKILGEQWKQKELLFYLEELQDVYKYSRNLKLRAIILRQWGCYFQQEGIMSIQKAEDYFHSAIKLFSKTDAIEVIKTEINLATTLHKEARHNEAREIFDLAINSLKKKGLIHWYARTLNNYGSMEYASGRIKEAESLYEQAIETFKYIGDDHWKSRVQCNMAALYLETNRKIKAFNLAKSILPILIKEKDEHWIKNAKRILIKQKHLKI